MDSEGAGIHSCDSRPLAGEYHAFRFNKSLALPPWCYGERVEVPLVSWSDFLVKQEIAWVMYAWIDVEGHEESVLRGMQLEGRRSAFPVMQYELGGTWADQRKVGHWTQGDAARYLEELGYEIYVIGVRHKGRGGVDEKHIMRAPVTRTMCYTGPLTEAKKTYQSGHTNVTNVVRHPKRSPFYGWSSKC